MSDSKIHEAAERAVDRMIAGAADTRRLDWLEAKRATGEWVFVSGENARSRLLRMGAKEPTTPTLRAASDAAIAAEESAKSVKGEKP